MATIPHYSQKGEKLESLKAADAIFGIEKINTGLIQEVVTAQLANRREANAHTKTRAEVRGGGKKPWKQKGTGRARHGSIRSPLWKGGGVTFGPRNDRNYTKKVNAKAKRRALCMVLSEKLREKKIIAVDAIALQDHKTKGFRKILEKLPKFRSMILVNDKADTNILKASRNFPQVSLIAPKNMNVYDTLLNDGVVFTKEALTHLIKHLS